MTGTIAEGKAGSADADLFRFSARAGEAWVFEVDAARSKSKLDSFLEVLDDQGRRVPRVVLQAVRDSYFTFRGKNGTEAVDFRLFNWEEMGINDYLYANGEVVKLWLYPRGPDSGFFVYPGQGSRWGYFDTTPFTHALNEPCYVVQPHPPGTELVKNGLPVFTIYHENDDDAHRELGKDSRLFFTAPADGDYLLKIRDVRGLQGPDFRYTLTARQCRPDFKVSLTGANPTVGAGGAKEFKVSAMRIDGFEGPIRVEFAGVPTGFRVSSPVIIEPGQIEAFGVVVAEEGAKEPPAAPASAIMVRASAQGRRHRGRARGQLAGVDQVEPRAEAAGCDRSGRGWGETHQRDPGRTPRIHHRGRTDDHAQGDGRTPRLQRPGAVRQRGSRAKPCPSARSSITSASTACSCSTASRNAPFSSPRTVALPSRPGCSISRPPRAEESPPNRSAYV